MSAKLWLVLGSVYGFLGVALGAFGAHGLRARLGPDLLAVWKTGVEYQFYHALALLAVGLLARGAVNTGALNLAGLCFAAGVLLFSGSLYALALSGVRVLGAVTPIGGVLFLAGWLCLLVAVLRQD
jgi:uncharacterized membrane protein YgdD (TMEM256/DUF423 family)